MGSNVPGYMAPIFTWGASGECGGARIVTLRCAASYARREPQQPILDRARVAALLPRPRFDVGQTGSARPLYVNEPALAEPRRQQRKQGLHGQRVRWIEKHQVEGLRNVRAKQRRRILADDAGLDAE